MLWLFVLLTSLSSLPPNFAREVGLRVWHNECACTLDGLTCWNEGEEFASLGIAHFIWYPRGKGGPFVETFPRLLDYFRENQVPLPRWLDEARFCPWKSRSVFLAAKHDKKMMDLRNLLKNTIDLQAQFLLKRLETAYAEIFSGLAQSPKKNKIEALYNKLMAKPIGQFALIDYVNFKGYGTSDKEKYLGSGWGLLQVLENMSEDPEIDPVVAFVRSAKEQLEKRVANSPTVRGEQRYLKGWFNRLDTYLPLEGQETVNRSSF